MHWMINNMGDPGAIRNERHSSNGLDKRTLIIWYSGVIHIDILYN